MKAHSSNILSRNVFWEHGIQTIAGRETLPVGGSIGIAIAPFHSMDDNTLVRIADHAMFRAKNSGGGGV